MDALFLRLFPSLPDDLRWLLEAVAIVLLGWLLGRLLARIVRLRLGNVLALGPLRERFALKDSEATAGSVGRGLYYIVMAFALWQAWSPLSKTSWATESLNLLQNVSNMLLANETVSFAVNLVLAFLLLLLLLRIFRFTHRYFEPFPAQIRSWKGKQLRDIRLQRVTLLSSHQLAELLVRVVGLLQSLLYIVELLIVMGLIFSIFPQTRGIMNDLLEIIRLLLASWWEALTDYLPKLVNLIIISFVTYYLLRFIQFLFKEIEKGAIRFSGFLPEWAEPTFKLVRVLVIALALVVSFPYLPGADSPAFQGISVFLGVLLSLGSSSLVANILAGIVMTYTGAFRVGDRIQIGTTTGDVIEKTLLVTRVRTIKNEDVTVPNGLVMNTHITNFSAVAETQGLILHTKVTIGYDVPWDQVHELMISAALKTADILADPKPFVLQTSLDDFAVAYQVNAYTRSPNSMAATYSNLHLNIQEAFTKANIEILSPHYMVVRREAPSKSPES